LILNYWLRMAIITLLKHMRRSNPIPPAREGTQQAESVHRYGLGEVAAD
jgi:hypothetical protein